MWLNRLYFGKAWDHTACPETSFYTKGFDLYINSSQGAKCWIKSLEVSYLLVFTNKKIDPVARIQYIPDSYNGNATTTGIKTVKECMMYVKGHDNEAHYFQYKESDGTCETHVTAPNNLFWGEPYFTTDEDGMNIYQMVSYNVPKDSVNVYS